MAISFSASAKAEICRSFPQKRCCALAECFGILLFCNSFGRDGIRIITESRDFAVMLPRLFKKAFGCSFDIVPDQDQTGKLSFQITAPEKILGIMSAYGFHPEDKKSESRSNLVLKLDLGEEGKLEALKGVEVLRLRLNLRNNSDDTRALSPDQTIAGKLRLRVRDGITINYDKLME